MSVFVLVLGVLSLRYLSTFKDEDLQKERLVLNNHLA